MFYTDKACKFLRVPAVEKAFAVREHGHKPQAATLKLLE